MAQLERAAGNSGATLLTESLVRELWLDANDQVLGVGYERPNGTIERVACRYIVLACNGFGGNREMVAQLLPEMRDATFAGHAGNDGSAITWGQQLGARLADLGGYQGHGSWAVPQGALISWALMMDGGVQIKLAASAFTMNPMATPRHRYRSWPSLAALHGMCLTGNAGPGPYLP